MPVFCSQPRCTRPRGGRRRIATQPQAPETNALKERQLKIWTAGEYARIGNPIAIMGELLCEAVEFLERARAAKPDIVLDGANAAAVAQICVLLDGLPLAIKLAAARVKPHSPRAMLGRLDRSLEVLVGGARDAPARQQTLRGTLRWSHELLGEPKRRLFGWLGVFAGGCTLEAAESVCGVPEYPAEETLRIRDESLLTPMSGRRVLRRAPAGGWL